LTDPELNKAATKIQASFRGHKVRKETGPKEGEEGEEEAAGQ
jgi:IQ calmodulin-binding motif.